MITDERAYSTPADEVLAAAESTREGLDKGEAEIRLELYGPNKLKETKKQPLILKILGELKNPMIILLLAAGIISGALGEIADMIIILVVVALNTVVGIVQEGKAEQALTALQKISSPHARVRRGGETMVLPAEQTVVGDILLLEAGDCVAADCRLIKSSSLRIDESALTGESVPAEKDADAAVGEDAPLGDRVTMAYSGCPVVYGTGEAVVTATGMNTELGRIAGSLSTTGDEQTPIQRRLSELSKILTYAVLGVCAVIFAISLIRDGTDALLPSFLLAVSLAVAAIPEGLAAVVTIVMAMGVRRMAERGAVIRRLPAVETLGCTSVICSDKTGTLTQNRMRVRRVFVDGKLENADVPLEEGGMLRLIEAMALCNDAAVSVEAEDGFVGDPTETALLELAENHGYSVTEHRARLPRAADFPFDSERKLMTTLHGVGSEYLQYTKGAPDILVKLCDRAYVDGNIIDITDEFRKRILAAYDEMAASALRVLAAAMTLRHELPANAAAAEHELVFIGLTGMMDPARPEVKKAVETCRAAGMLPVMITGDHITTACAIARELGILDGSRTAMTGAELDKLSDEEFDTAVKTCAVYARVSPAHKVRIVDAWLANGAVTAMTGDGVNDAPALKRASIGVGMGITGTEVSKSVADMVLTDDNFSTIILAVEEGRKIYSNIRKCVRFLLSCNLAEVLAVLVSTLMGAHMLGTVQILWINLISDTFPALALGMEPAEKNVMRKPPRDPNAGIFAGGVGVSIVWQGAVIAAATLGAFLIGRTASDAAGSTMAFLTLALSQLFHSLDVRSDSRSMFTNGFGANKWAAGALLLSLLLTLIPALIPALAGIFGFVMLSGTQWLLTLVLSFAIVPVAELVKFIRRMAGK